MKVWIDQDLCTGDGLCEEIAPDVFTLLDDGLASVREGDKIYATAKGNPQGADGMASFPDNQEEIAVLINCDGMHGNTHNWLQNSGMIVARGGAPNGNGGDVAYHGIAPDGSVSPPPGNVDTSGSGSGAAGDFRGE